MEFRRTFLYFALAIIGVMLWHAWQLDYPPVHATTTETSAKATSSNEFTPEAYDQRSEPYQNTAKTPTSPQGKMIAITTDVLKARINLEGGNLVDATLPQYSVSLDDRAPVQILNPNHDALYITQSGITGNEGIVYHADQDNYSLKDNEKQLIVTLVGETKDGIAIRKTFTFARGKYDITTAMQLTNYGNTVWRGNAYNQITRRDVPVSGGYLAARFYNGGAVSTKDTPYKKLSFSDMAESDFSLDIKDGWIAMQQHYFISAWVPEKNQTLHYYSRSFGKSKNGSDDIFVLGYLSESLSLAPKATTAFTSTLYVGPEIPANLAPLAKSLDLTIDYGWLWPISKFLFWLMSKIYSYLGNWGWSIVAVTILIKIAFYGLSNKSYVSMARTRDLQPRIKALRERHGDDKQAMSKAMMELYRKEKINPLGGCLPMLIQIPVFFALYYVLIESVELRQAPFIFWIHDLSVKDPYFILPVLMGLSMFLQQKLSPPPPDPTQAKMMMMLPLIMTVFFVAFPAGLVLYWLTNNCASILQQWIVMKRHARKA
ncbi:MAG: membrane protein insertase YidC [Gammaproteobacteria bacterium RIFCSPHIGHO2_12_FULL_42_13]|nr:MAG: membrane protein insertase YidC [Gammaproteobacteria bacterium RIFCSPHIGHO2_12_FULL_42_13]